MAGVVLVVAVLPAELGVDPTGAGGWLGLTAMGRSRASAAEPTPSPPPAPTWTFRTDALSLSLDPGEGAEIKADMRAGDQLVYTWTADRGELFFDFHGERHGAAADAFTSYGTGTKATDKGAFEAPFDGIHGWYWKNATFTRVTVRIETSGVYASLERK